MIRVRVPATSANIGPGFDALGVAFNLYNEYEFDLNNNGIVFENVEEEFMNENNIILISMKKVFEKYRFSYTGLKIKIIKQDIPVSRGLGSSSSCIVAGIIGAFAIMSKKIDKDEVFYLATEIEGHPDNVSPAIFGGMVVSISDNNELIYNNIDMKPGIKFVALIPSATSSTKEARAILPKEISLEDGIFNVGRVALLVSCFQNGNYKLLKYATKDKFHEIYRGKLICGYEDMYEMCYKNDALGCFLSGAGPTLMSICRDNDDDFIEQMQEYINVNKLPWDIKELSIDYDGAIIFYK